MFKELKMKIAARRVERKKARSAANKKSRNTKSKSTKRKPSFWNRAWNIICKPFRAIANMFKRIWSWIRSIDLIGLVNLTLLIAIIVLFSMLIIDVVNCNKKQVVIITPEPVNTTIVADKPAPKRDVKPRTQTPALPLKKSNQTNEFANKPVNVVPVKKCTVATNQVARTQGKMYGDVIIDTRGMAHVLQNGTQINGNLYLQNMRKYTLPCNVRIDGNLFLRDVNMLQFCGEFTVTGNIYVSPKSSFGPIPRTARVGGQVII